jgi:hypothetical protein
MKAGKGLVAIQLGKFRLVKGLWIGKVISGTVI